MGAPIYVTTAYGNNPPPPYGYSTKTVTTTTRTTVTSQATATAGAVIVQEPIGNFYLQAQDAANGATGLYAQVIGDSGSPDDSNVYYR